MTRSLGAEHERADDGAYADWMVTIEFYLPFRRMILEEAAVLFTTGNWVTCGSNASTTSIGLRRRRNSSSKEISPAELSTEALLYQMAYARKFYLTAASLYHISRRSVTTIGRRQWFALGLHSWLTVPHYPRKCCRKPPLFIVS